MPHPIINRRVFAPPGGAGGGIVAPAGTALDTLITQGATVLRAYSVRKVRTAYAGSCAILRGNGTGSPETTVPFTSGAMDLAVSATAAASGGGTAAYWKTIFDQSVNASNATQTTAANQVIFGTDMFATGSMGVAAGAQANCWLDFFIPGPPAQPLSMWVVCSGGTGTVNASRFLVGTWTSATQGLCEITSSRQLAMNWGPTLVATGANFSGKVTTLGVANGATSKLYYNGTLRNTNNAGTVTTAYWRIGANSAPSTQNWFGWAGNTITEIIIFQGDPTSLAGWAAFVADAKSYFGTA